MAGRIRSLKPEFWSDGNVVLLSPYARLFYMGMWNFACDGGHLPSDAVSLKLQILPMDDVDPFELLDELLRLGRVELRTADGRRYIKILRFADHQRLDARWAARCVYCRAEKANEWSKDDSQSLAETHADPAETHADSQRLTQTRASLRGVPRGSAGFRGVPRGSAGFRGVSVGGAKPHVGVEWSGVSTTHSLDVSTGPKITNGAALVVVPDPPEEPKKEPKNPIQIFRDAFGCSTKEAQVLNKRMRNSISPKSPPGMARYLVESGQAADWLSEHRAAERKAAVEEEDRRIRSGPQCEHGVRGGEMVNAVTQRMRCGVCNRRTKLSDLSQSAVS